MLSFLTNLIPGVGLAKIGGTVLKYVLIIGVPLAACVGLYFYVTGLQAKNLALTVANQQLSANIAAQKAEIGEQTQAISNWSATVARYQALMAQQQAFNQNAEQTVRNLQNVFIKRDLSKEAISQPSVLLSHAQLATDNALRMLQCASGDTSSCTPTAPAAPASPGPATAKPH